MLLGIGTAGGQVLPMTFAEMVREADQIVVAEAIDQRANWVTSGRHRNIVTSVTFRVTRTLKGAPRVLLLLDFLGGTVGETRQDVSGVPRFAIGDRAVLFVTDGRSASPIVGHMQGRFPIATGPDGRQYVTLYNRLAFSAVGQVGAPITVSPTPIPTMTLEAFEREIAQMVGGANR